MKYNDFKGIMKYLRNEVRKFCRGQMPTIDEAELLASMLSGAVGLQYDIMSETFLMKVDQFVRDEILRVCA